MAATKFTSGIWDNHKRGTVGQFLGDRIKPEADLSFVSAYFTIYAYMALCARSRNAPRRGFNRGGIS